MQQKTYQPIMQSSRFLAEIHEKMAEHEKTLLLVRRHLPKDLRAHCQSVVINANTLIIQTQNAAWASRIRFDSDQLLTALRPHFPEHLSKINKIQCRIIADPVMSFTTTKTSQQHFQLQLSTHKALQLQQHIMPNDEVNKSWQALLLALTR